MSAVAFESYLSQVLIDWRPSKPPAGVPAAVVAHWQDAEVQAVSSFLAQQKVDAIVAKSKRSSESQAPPWENRLANKHWVAAVDNALRCLTGIGLIRFKPRFQPPAMLQRGERRYFEVVPSVGDG